MKTLNLITLLLIIVGGVNWGLIALANINLVAALFGTDTVLTNLVYGLVGLSAVYQIIPFTQALSSGEISAEAGRI
jgi:uncharacterized protein